MDYKIVEKDSFTVVGKSIQVSTREGENSQRIPQFWQDCLRNGTVEKLNSVGTKEDLLGICMHMDHAKEEFTYVIAVEDDPKNKNYSNEFSTRDIPAAAWAVFPSIGPMPGAIQKVWGRIFQEWFPSTGYEHAGGPELEVYPAGDATADDYRCEVWVPIVKK